MDFADFASAYYGRVHNQKISSVNAPISIASIVDTMVINLLFEENVKKFAILGIRTTVKQLKKKVTFKYPVARLYERVKFSVHHT